VLTVEGAWTFGHLVSKLAHWLKQTDLAGKISI
jgi:hypothetical protein